MDPVSLGGSVSNGDQGPSQTPSEPQEQLGNPFLNEVAPDHRSVVAPYLKKWDANVTQLTQKLNEKFKPYEELGPLEEIQKYVTFAKNFRQDPEASFRAIWNRMEEHYGDNFQTELLRILQLQEQQEEMNEQQFESQEGYEGSPDPDDVFRQNVTTELEEFKAWRQAQEERAEFEEQNAQFESLLETMHTQFGEFDDDWVTNRISIHGDPKKALQEWSSLVDGIVKKNGGTPRQPPKTISGQGGVPNPQIDVAKLRGEDRRAYVEQLLSQGD